jgi:hypothetical protein
VRSKLALWQCVGVSLCLVGAVGRVPAQAHGSAAAQQMLDFLARPATTGVAVAKDSPLPARYADWNAAQQKSGFQQAAQRCTLVNALEHDNPASRILPQPMTLREEAELAVSVCVPAKMPADWPNREKYLDDARRLIDRARSYGSTLHLLQT